MFYEHKYFKYLFDKDGLWSAYAMHAFVNNLQEIEHDSYKFLFEPYNMRCDHLR